MPIRFRFALFALAGLAFAAPPASAQRPADRGPCDAVLPAPFSATGARADYVRAAQALGLIPVDGTGLIRPSGQAASPLCVDPDSMLWPTRPAGTRDAGAATALPVRLRQARNTAYPRDRNNGLLWAGRGTSVSLQAGVAYRRGPFSAAGSPVVAWSENLPFRHHVALPPFSPFANPWHTAGLDLPTRFGDDQTLDFHPGESYVRYDRGTLALGVSTEALWIGPARHNPVLMSNTAPGFPHIFAGTGEPLETGIGAFEVQVLAGQLAESDYWDENPDNDHRLITAFTLTYRPRWVPGLHVGIGRVYNEIREPGRLPLDRVLLNLVDVPLLDVVSDTRGNEIASIFARWVFPEAGFEAYGEWGREEDPASLSDFLAEPDYSQGYMLGAQKVFRGGPLWWSFWSELTHLGPSSPVLRGRTDAPFYTSIIGGQGHTNHGQGLGAWIGPGSETQAFGLDAFLPFGMLGVYGRRVRYHESAYYIYMARTYGESRHDVELTAGLRAALNAGPFEVDFDMGFSHRLEPLFANLDGISFVTYDRHNLMFDVLLSWRP